MARLANSTAPASPKLAANSAAGSTRRNLRAASGSATDDGFHYTRMRKQDDGTRRPTRHAPTLSLRKDGCEETGVSGDNNASEKVQDQQQAVSQETRVRGDTNASEEGQDQGKHGDGDRSVSGHANASEEEQDQQKDGSAGGDTSAGQEDQNADAILDKAVEKLIASSNADVRPLEQLDKYHTLWQQYATTDTASKLEEHPKHEAIRGKLLELFDAIYDNKGTTEKNLRSVVRFLRSDKCQWQHELAGLRLYAHFGRDGCKRTFLVDLKDFACARKEDEDLEHTTGPSFGVALALMKEARDGRRSKSITTRGAGLDPEWLRIDCAMAIQWAHDRLGFSVPKKNNKQRQTQAGGNEKVGLDEDATGREGDTFQREETEGEIEVGRCARELQPPAEQDLSSNFDGSMAMDLTEPFGKITDASHRGAREGDGLEREETEREETERDETERDETERDETERDETERDETERDETEREETDRDETERNIEAGRGAQNLQPPVEQDRPSSFYDSIIDMEMTEPFRANFDALHQETRERTARTRTSPEHSMFHRPATPPRSSFSSLHAFSDFSGDLPSNTSPAAPTSHSVPTTPSRTMHKARGIRSGRHGSEPPAKKSCPSPDYLHDLQRASQFLSLFSTEPAKLVSRSTVADPAHSLSRWVVVHEWARGQPVMTTVLAPPGAFNESHTTTPSYKSWSLIYIQYESVAQPCVRLHSNDITVRAASVREYLQRDLPPAMWDQFSRIPLNDYEILRLPDAHDVRDDDSTGLLKCIALNVCQIVDQPLPKDWKVFLALWRGAVDLASGLPRGRISGVRQNISLPESPQRQRQRDAVSDAPQDDFLALLSESCAEMTLRTMKIATLTEYKSAVSLLQRCVHEAESNAVAAHPAANSNTQAKIEKLEDLLHDLAPDDPFRQQIQTQLNQALESRGRPRDSTKLDTLRELLAWASLSSTEVENALKSTKEEVCQQLSDDLLKLKNVS